MGSYSAFHWLIVVALLGYLLALVKVARSRPVSKPGKDSKTWLITQLAIAWLGVLLFGFLALVQLAANAYRQGGLENPQPGNLVHRVGYLVGWLITVLGVPLLCALSVRRARSLMHKWKAG